MDDFPTIPVLGTEIEALAALEAHARASDWLRRHPEEDPAEVTARELADVRRELGLSE